jgi:hypothetical protein
LLNYLILTTLSFTDNDSIVTTSSSTASTSNLGVKKKEKKVAKVKKSAAPKKGAKIDRGELICSSSHDSMEEINPSKKWAPNLVRKFTVSINK